MKTEFEPCTRHYEDKDIEGRPVVDDCADGLCACGGAAGSHSVGVCAPDGHVGGGVSSGDAGEGHKFVLSDVRCVDGEDIRRIVPAAQDNGQWQAHFIASLHPNLSERYAKHFFEEAAFVGCNGIELKKLYGDGVESAPFLYALMQLSSIQSVVSVANGRDMTIGFSIWDCFFGSPQYSESMSSMWRYLYKVLKLGGAGRIDFTILFDSALGGQEAERQKEYMSFCSAFFKKLGAGRRLSIVMVDKKLKKQIYQ